MEIETSNPSGNRNNEYFNKTKENPTENEEKFEIMIDITNFVKISPFVDRYFVKFYYPWKQAGLVTDHFTFQHTNK
jgi:hypothetical protein